MRRMARNQPTALLVETECIEKDPGLTGLKEETATSKKDVSSTGSRVWLGYSTDKNQKQIIMEKNKYSGESNRASKVAVSGSCMRRNSKRGNLGFSSKLPIEACPQINQKSSKATSDEYEATQLKKKKKEYYKRNVKDFLKYGIGPDGLSLYVHVTNE